jgi:hypothetical protein
MSTETRAKCKRDACQNYLTGRQQSFCSHACRNQVLCPGRKGGRPSSYRQEFARQELFYYIKACEAHTIEVINKKGAVVKKAAPYLPTLIGYACFLAHKFNIYIHANTLRNWARFHREFADCLNFLKSIQHHYLLNFGLSRVYNSSMAVFLLKSNHGYLTQKKRQQHEEEWAKKIVRDVYRRADEMMEDRLTEASGV